MDLSLFGPLEVLDNKLSPVNIQLQYWALMCFCGFPPDAPVSSHILKDVLVKCIDPNRHWTVATRGISQ